MSTLLTHHFLLPKQRQAWSPFFDDMNAIIFLAPISCFDEKLAEDRRVNRLEDSFLLWKAVCSNKLLAKTQLILFLNKCDLLEKKLKAGVMVKDYVPSFGDRSNSTGTVAKCECFWPWVLFFFFLFPVDFPSTDPLFTLDYRPHHESFSHFRFHILFPFNSKIPLNNVYLCRFEAEVQGSIKAIFARAEAILRSLNICNCASFGFYVMHPCLFFLPAPSLVFQDTKATAITLGAGVFSPLAPLLNVV